MLNEDVDAIIARAMAEYNSRHNTSDNNNQTTTVPEVSEAEEIEAAKAEGAIPINSKSILVEQTTSRFSSAIWYDKIKETSVLLAGLGGIGSYIYFLLSRMQPFSIRIYDDDIVEAANMSGQLYSKNDIGNFKATAIAIMGIEYSDFHRVASSTERFTSETPVEPIMICGFDNMEARNTFFNSWLEGVSHTDKPEDWLFIDGRLAAEEFQVFAVRGDDTRAINDYRKNWLFADYQADETICSYKQTSFCANMIASVMVNVFVNFIANKCNPLIPRDTPYLTQYNAETMYFKVTQ